MYIENPQTTFTRNLNKIIELYMERTGTSMRGIYRKVKAGGMNTMTFDYYLRGERWPRPEQLQVLCETFGVPVEMFFRR